MILFSFYSSHKPDSDLIDDLRWSIKNKIPLPAGHKPELDIYDPTDLATDECLLFSYTVFEFISSAGSDNNLKLSCNVKGEDL